MGGTQPIDDRVLPKLNKRESENKIGGGNFSDVNVDDKKNLTITTENGIPRSSKAGISDIID